MVDFLNVKTIDSDDEIAQESEEEIDESPKTAKKTKKIKKKKTDFDAGFDLDFSSGNQSSVWKIDETFRTKAKGLMSTEIIEEKIEEKRKAKKENKVTGKEEKERKELKKETEALPFEQDEAKESDEDNVFSDSEENVREDSDQSENEDEKSSFFTSAPTKEVNHETFSEMNLSRPLLRAVNDLNFVNPTEIQSTTIPLALLGRDLCACASTGSGKTAAFMLPVLERLIYKPKKTIVTRVLVLVPTRELAIQVHSVSQNLAKYTGVSLCLAAGGLDSKTQEANLRKNPDIIIATPGRLIDHLHNAPTFDLQTVEILVLDEADRMLEEHFKDQMTELIRLCPRSRQTMLFSATMTDEVQELATLSLNKPVKLFVNQNTDVAKNLHQEFLRIRPNREYDRLPIVAALCCRTFHDHTVVFLQTKRLAHKLRIILGLCGLKCGELHGDLTQLQRLESLEKFKNNEIDILVATDLAARGLDIPHVKTVVSFNLPTTIKSYIHRVGRTARAGKVGRSITLVGEKERKMLKDIVKNSKIPVKNRIMSAEVIEKYKKKLEEMENDIKDIMKQEEEEKQIRIAEMQANKAKNMIIHNDEIMSRPARTYINTKNDNAKKKNEKRDGKDKNRKKTDMSEDDKKIRKFQEFQVRQMKRERKPKRKRAFDDKEENTFSKGPKKARLVASNSSFDQDLTDVSRKKVKSLRSNHVVKKKRTNRKSKSRHKKR